MTEQAPSTLSPSKQAPTTQALALALAEIDKLITTFFAVIDNRGDKAPAYQDFTPLFVQTVMIYKRQGDTIEAMDLDTFLTPRIALLNDGTLVDFHEWESDHQTHINRGIATRVCRYGKKGQYNGEPYAGEGEKHIQLILTDEGWKITSVVWEDLM